MSPRPRTVHDDAILDAAVQVLSRIGASKMTLADVGSEVGLSAATLVQRFGSKRELMLAVKKHVIDHIQARFEHAAASHESPLDALVAAAADRPGPLDGHITLANRMSFFFAQMDDPEFHALAVQNRDRAIEGFQKLLESAIQAGEMTDGNIGTRQLAETIYSMQMGSLITWSIANEGTAKARVKQDLDTLLRPFRRGPRKSSQADRLAPKPVEAQADTRPF
jgi:AcrR family transcriptional regulator